MRNMAIIRALVDDIVTVTDDEIREAMGVMVKRMKTVVEPSGAIVLAVAKKFPSIHKSI